MKPNEKLWYDFYKAYDLAAEEGKVDGWMGSECRSLIHEWVDQMFPDPYTFLDVELRPDGPINGPCVPNPNKQI